MEESTTLEVTTPKGAYSLKIFSMQINVRGKP
jgi:hypothetical protein